MHIEKLTVKNFKCFDDLNMNFKEGVNLLLGDNGVGKSSILDAIAVALGGYLKGTGIGTRNIGQDDIRKSIVKISDYVEAARINGPSEISCTAIVSGECYTWTRRRKDELSSSRTGTVPNAIIKKANRLMNDESAVLPVIAYYGIGRLGKFRRAGYGRSVKSNNDRRSGYIGAVEANLDIKGMMTWCLDMERLEFKLKKEIPAYEKFKKTINEFLSAVTGDDGHNRVFYSYDYSDLAYGSETDALPLSLLSAGYQSIILMVMDFAYRNAKLNPTLEFNADIPGIVLIDEIDMHLHPEWQWRIVPAMTKVFPAVQFIIATHSPFIISSGKCMNILQISSDHEVYEADDVYADSVSDIVRFIQGSSDIPKHLQAMYASFDDAIDEFDFAEARKIYSEMLLLYGEDNTSVKKARLLLDSFDGEDSL